MNTGGRGNDGLMVLAPIGVSVMFRRPHFAGTGYRDHLLLLWEVVVRGKKMLCVHPGDNRSLVFNDNAGEARADIMWRIIRENNVREYRAGSILSPDLVAGSAVNGVGNWPSTFRVYERTAT
jgi:hypothetical protein